MTVYELSLKVLIGKACTKCRKLKPLAKYHRSAKVTDGRASWCKKCANSIYREARKRNYSYEQKRRWQVKSRYGLSMDQVGKMLEKQGVKCAICSRELDKFHIDHCHATNEVRGILCHGCNIKIGGWDDAEWRAKAMQYLGLI